MVQLVNRAAGLLFALLAVVGMCTLAMIALGILPNLLGISIAILIVISSFWVGLFVYRRVSIEGIINSITVINASPDLNILQPSSGTQTRVRTVYEIIELIMQDSHFCKGGRIRIFGDWFDKSHKNYFKIIGAKYSQRENILTITFEDSREIAIVSPEAITESPTFLKIGSADRITLKQSEVSKYCDALWINYRKEGKQIKTALYPNNSVYEFDINLEDEAFMILR